MGIAGIEIRDPPELEKVTPLDGNVGEPLEFQRVESVTTGFFV